VVRGVADVLPAAVCDFSRVGVINGGSGDPTERYRDFVYGNFRPIEKRVHVIEDLENA
jgi:hypothetical protein